MLGSSEIRHRIAHQAEGEKVEVQTSNEKRSLRRDKRKYRLFGIFHFCGICFLIAVISYIVHVSDNYLPISKSIDAPETVFSGDRARKHLEAITSIGPRPSGSYANDVKAAEYILKELIAIKDQAYSAYHIEVEVQSSSGSFAFVRKSKLVEDVGFTVTYDDTLNVVAKISSNVSEGTFILANAHYDTVMNTEGATDDTVNCALLIEIFRAIARTAPTELKHGVIFLFNGAEEGGLSGSHGFLQHRWFPLVKAVINVEGAGCGGREFVFQTGPDEPWIIETYASSAKYPFASVIAQEIFNSGVIPSDTDFRVFVQYGKLIGIDVAFISNGYVYHTRYDDAKSVPSGSIQRAGDNIHSLMTAMTNSEYLVNAKKYKHGNTVFYDILGVLFVHYPARLNVLINNITCIIVVLYIFLHIINYKSGRGHGSHMTITSLSVAIITIIFSWILTFIVPLSVTFILMKCKLLMTWYSCPKFAILVYGLPALFGLLLGHYIGKLLIAQVDGASAQSFTCAHLLIYSVILYAANQREILSTHILWFWIAFPFLFLCVILDTISEEAKGKFFYIFHILAVMVPALMTMYQSYSLLDFFAALFGRTGSEVPSDIIIAVFTALNVVMVFSFLMNLYRYAADMKKFLLFVGFVSILPLFYVLVVKMHPYSARNPITPKRLYMQHILRTFHGSNGSMVRQDSGIWIQPMDTVGFRSLESINFFKQAEKFQCDGSYCGLPYYYAKRKIMSEPRYLRGERPEVGFTKLSTKVYRREEKTDGHIRFHFDITGPDHMTLYLTLRDGVILDWSMYKNEDGHIYKMDDYHGGYTHIVFYTHGYNSGSWKFWMEFKKSTLSPVLGELGLARHYLHGEYSRTRYLNAAIHALPDWVCDSSWVSAYDSFTLQ